MSVQNISQNGAICAEINTFHEKGYMVCVSVTL